MQPQGGGAQQAKRRGGEHRGERKEQSVWRGRAVPRWLSALPHHDLMVFVRVCAFLCQSREQRSTFFCACVSEMRRVSLTPQKRAEPGTPAADTLSPPLSRAAAAAAAATQARSHGRGAREWTAGSE